MRKKTITLYEPALSNLLYLKSRVAGRSNVSVVEASLTLTADVLRRFEDLWSEMSEYFRKAVGVDVPPPEEVAPEVLADFISDLWFAAQRKRRAIGSEFFRLFAQQLASAAGRPEKACEVAGALSTAFWEEGRNALENKGAPYWKKLLEVDNEKGSGR